MFWYIHKSIARSLSSGLRKNLLPVAIGFCCWVDVFITFCLEDCFAGLRNTNQPLKGRLTNSFFATTLIRSSLVSWASGYLIAETGLDLPPELFTELPLFSFLAVFARLKLFDFLLIFGGRGIVGIFEVNCFKSVVFMYKKILNLHNC